MTYLPGAWSAFMDERSEALKAEILAVNEARKERERRIDVAQRILRGRTENGGTEKVRYPKEVDDA